MRPSGGPKAVTRISLARYEKASTVQWIRLFNSIARRLDLFRDYAHESLFLELLSSPCLQFHFSLRS
jgi:hypothetical protein